MIAHGTVNAYSNGGCRCQRCRAAWAAYYRSKPKRQYYKKVACPYCGVHWIRAGTLRCFACRVRRVGGPFRRGHKMQQHPLADLELVFSRQQQRIRAGSEREPGEAMTRRDIYQECALEIRGRI